MSNALLPAIAFIAFTFALIPLLFHWRSRNVPLLSIIGWLAVADLTRGINAVLWDGNVDVKDLLWCDITTKLKIGEDIGLPASAFALALQVHRITVQKSRLSLKVDLTICVGIPVLIMALHTIVQGHRFDIYEDFGCSPAIYVSIPSVLILDVPAFLAAALALVHCNLALFNFAKQRRTFARMAGSANTGLTKSQYVRLVALTLTLGMWDALAIGLTSVSTYRDGLLPWISWAYVHADFNNFEGAQFSIALIPDDILGWIYFAWISVPISSLIVFVFFAVGGEAAKEYRSGAQWLRNSVPGLRSTSSSNTQRVAISLNTFSVASRYHPGQSVGSLQTVVKTIDSDEFEEV